MPELPYTNRELEEKWSDISNKLNRIEAQTIKTNGRVGILENWKYLAMGAVSVLSILVVPILVWAISTLVNIDSRIQASVDSALSAYNISK